jgi:glycosyltransferase involved in cell wall biosynthesis
VYDIFDSFADKVGGLPPWLRRAIRWADHSLMKYAEAVVVTDDRRKALLDGVRVRELAVIMNVPPLPPEPAPLDKASPLRVCYAGVIHEHRGLSLIAEATRGLDGVETVFAGWVPRPSDRDLLERQAHIRFLGKIAYEESLRLLGASDVILALYDPSVPINVMASSNKIYEAMSVARPVITNEETAMAGIVTEERCGCLVPYGDAAALRAAIVRLRDDRAAGEQLGRNGHSAFASKYNWAIMEERLLRLYRSVLTSATVL